MGGNSSPAPQADPRVGEAAVMQAQLGQEYLAFTKEQFAVSTEMQKELNATSKEVSDYFFNIAKEDRERYESVFKPIEDEFVKQASEFDTPARQEEAAGKARADVLTQAASERGTAQRQMTSMGVSPDSGRFAGVDRAVGLGTTMASVGAQNTARDNIRDKGLQLKAAAIDVGRGLPASAGAGMQAGLGAAGTGVANHAAGVGIVAPGYSGAMSGQKGMADILNTQHKNQLAAWETESKLKAANAQGFGQFAGTAVGLMLSSKEAKTNREPVAEGSSLEAVKSLPIDEYDYKPGMGDGGHHVGPMAEDFKSATGKGDGKTIAMQDAIGLTMGAVKDLAKKVDRLSDAIGLGAKRNPAMA